MLSGIAQKLFNGIEKFKISLKYDIYDLGEGMQLYNHKDTKEKLLVNLLTGEKFRLVDETGSLIHITEKDIDFDRVDQLENSHNARRLYSPYYFSVGPYRNGIAMITWTLYPDGRYFADEDGFGGEDNDEVNVYGYIDKNGKMVIPFSDICKEQ